MLLFSCFYYTKTLCELSRDFWFPPESKALCHKLFPHEELAEVDEHVLVMNWPLELKLRRQKHKSLLARLSYVGLSFVD